jgi:hypothetical protein
MGLNNSIFSPSAGPHGPSVGAMKSLKQLQQIKLRNPRIFGSMPDVSCEWLLENLKPQPSHEQTLPQSDPIFEF